MLVMWANKSFSFSIIRKCPKQKDVHVAAGICGGVVDMSTKL